MILYATAHVGPNQTVAVDKRPAQWRSELLATSVAGQPMNREPLSNEADLALAFAAEAGERGWSRSTFEAFCVGHHITFEQQQYIWPNGIRSVARSLNEGADQQMLRAWANAERASMVDIILRRFADNQPLKSSVAQLAKSDFLHPFDTLTRTARTAERMLLCRGGYRRSGPVGQFIERWTLVLAYSACVLVWIGDHTEDQRRTDRATRRFLAIAGLD